MRGLYTMKQPVTPTSCGKCSKQSYTTRQFEEDGVALSASQRLGPYEIVAQIGAGGDG